MRRLHIRHLQGSGVNLTNQAIYLVKLVSRSQKDTLEQIANSSQHLTEQQRRKRLAF
jgi:hypothetical protein